MRRKCHRLDSAQKTRVSCTSGVEGDRKLPALRQIDKASGNNIYIYSAGAIWNRAENAKDRVNNFPGRAFRNKDGASGCNLAGIAISLVGLNLDRALWSI